MISDTLRIHPETKLKYLLKYVERNQNNTKANNPFLNDSY